MATQQERQDQHLRQAHRQLSQAIMALDDAAHELGMANWHQTASEVGGLVTMAEDAQDAMERYAAGAGVTLTGPGAVSYEQAFLEGPWRNKWLGQLQHDEVSAWTAATPDQRRHARRWVREDQASLAGLSGGRDCYARMIANAVQAGVTPDAVSLYAYELARRLIALRRLMIP